MLTIVAVVIKAAIIALARQYKNRRIITQSLKKPVPKSVQWLYDAHHLKRLIDTGSDRFRQRGLYRLAHTDYSPDVWHKAHYKKRLSMLLTQPRCLI